MADRGTAQWSMALSGFANDDPKTKEKFAAMFADIVNMTRALPGHGGYEDGNGNAQFFSSFEPETYYHETQVEKKKAEEKKPEPAPTPVFSREPTPRKVEDRRQGR